MDTLLQDLRYALRGLRNAPGFTLVAVLTLALGIGVNSTIFSLVNAILLRSLPVEEPDRLVNIYAHPSTSQDHGTLSYPNYLDYQEQTQTLESLMGYSNFFANLSIEGSSELVVGEIVTESYFPTLGVRPALGRAFSAEEYAAPGTSAVAILSHPFWQSRFGADPDIVGRTFRMNGIVYTVIGVAPASFGGMFPAVTSQMWIPTAMVEEVEVLGNQRVSGPSVGDTRLDRRGQHWMWVKGRMADGVELPQVRAELDRLAVGLAEQYPEQNELEVLTVLATNDVAINPDFDRTLAPVGMVLLGAVGLVLLVACANLANMLLARASTRSREVAVRLAVGASRGRLIRQMLTESLLLALAGGVAALLLATWLARLIQRLQPPLPIELGLDIQPDWRVWVFTLAAAVVTGVIFGLMPALKSSRPDLVPALKEADAESAGGRTFELRDGLVVVQVAVSMVLLVAASLLVRSLGAAHEVDLGYDADRIAYMGLAMEMNGYDAVRSGEFFETARGRLIELPGVDAVGLTSRLNLSLNNNGFGLFIDGHQTSGTDRPYIQDGAYVDEGYFDAMGLQILSGRGIEPADRDERLRVAVVTEAMAARYWPDMDPLGREFRTSWEGEPYRIVGVVEDHKVDTPGEAAKPYLHLPLRRDTEFGVIVVRTAGPAADALPGLERELRRLDPDLVFLETGALRTQADIRIFPVRAGAWLIGIFGGLALVLAAVGLYGVVGYSVSRRVREIGIRKALGAETGRILGLVLRRGMLMVVVGGVVGAALAALSARFLSSVLFVGAFDALSFVASFLVLASVAALANLIPARRASRVDPMVALKGD